MHIQVEPRLTAACPSPATACGWAFGEAWSAACDLSPLSIRRLAEARPPLKQHHTRQGSPAKAVTSHRTPRPELAKVLHSAR
jgi:hypothetical protein